MLSKREMNIQSIGLKRNTLDQYYTKPELASKYIDIFMKIVEPKLLDVVVEPSAGTGSFSDILKEKLECQLLSYDIDPKNDYTEQQDFLDIDSLQFSEKKVHCIGNPPFGRQSSLAKKFIKKCCEFSYSIAFILPKSFKKQSFYKTFALKFHKIYEEDCPSNSFIVNEREYDVPCVYQIWMKNEVDRDNFHKYTPDGFQYTSKTETPHFSVRRVGFYAGRVDTDYKLKSKQSHYFIKINEDVLHRKNLEDIIKKLNSSVYDANNTVGAKSISKQEFTKVMNPLLV